MSYVTAVRASTWNVRLQLTAIRPTNWAVTAGSVTSYYATGYGGGYGPSGAVASVTATRATTWAEQGRVTRTRVALWAVESTASYVTALRASTWRVAATVTGTRGTLWTSYSTVLRTRIALWAANATVTRTAGAFWSVLGAATPTTTPGMRLRVFAPNGADLGPLPVPEGVSVAYPLDDVGGLSLTYAARAPRSDLLGQPCEIAVEISPDNGITWAEPVNSRFVYLTDGRDPLDPLSRYTVEAKSYVWRLSKARILPNGLVNAEGKRAFLSATPGVILKTLLNEAQARGALTGISHSSFTTTADSAGVGWANVLTIYYEPGLDYLALLLNLADQGMVDFRMQGRVLYVYNPNAAMAVDRTVGSAQVVLRAGRDLTEAPFRRTWEGLADFAYFAGDAGSSYSTTNAGASKPWGRQETFIANGSVSDPGTMAALTQAELSLGDHERTEYTRGLDFTHAADLPFFDYSVGDYVWSAIDGTALTRLRVRQLTLTRDDKARVGGNVVLNDRFLESDVRAKRRIEGITNGASGNNPLPGPGPLDGDAIAPGQVLGLVGSSVAYLGPGGFVQAQATLSWAAPLVNVDGTPITDLDSYEIFSRPFGTPPASMKQTATTTDTSIDMSPYVAGSSWVFAVRAVDTSGNRGAKSGDLAVGMAVDNTPPQVPSTPVVTSRLGTLSISWDGLPSSGSWPADFDYVEVHTSGVNNFTPSVSTLFDTLYGAGVAILADSAFGIPVFVKLIAVDKSGLKSVPSAQGSGTPARLVGTDVDPGAITYEQIGFKDPGNLIADGSFETPGIRSNVAFKSAAAWTFTTADKYHGDYAATINAATNPSTTRQLVLMSPAEAQQMMGGDKLFCRFAYKATPGATGVLQLVAAWIMQDGSTQTSTLVGSVKSGSWQQAAAQLTAPANVQDVRIYVELTAAGTSGTYTVDAVEVRRTVGTAIIQDAAITNAQIGTLAVNSAQIMSLDVGKLTAGTMNADVLVAGKLMTASSGNRLEMSGTGLRMYKGSTLTGHWSPQLGQLRIFNTTDVTATSTGHGMQFGDDNDYNLVIDNNEIAARFNGQYDLLYLNRQGGDVWIGSMIITDDGIRGSAIQGTQAMKGQKVSSTTDIDVNSSTPFYDSPNLSITFKAPASGRVAVGVGGACNGTAGGSCYIGFDTQNGQPGGSTFRVWDPGDSFEVRGPNYVRGMNFGFLDGMTPGNTYSVNCRTMISGTGPGHVFFRRLMVLPQM